MSRQGMIAASQYADGLLEFESLAAAETALFNEKERVLAALVGEYGEALSLDFSRESLKPLEKWFFESECPDTGKGGYSVTHAIGYYFGEVLCRIGGFRWVVEGFSFQQGRYEIGIRSSLLTMMLTSGKRLTMQGNKRMQSLWRECGTYL